MTHKNNNNIFITVALLFITVFLTMADDTCAAASKAQPSPRRVVVTGAGGQTGQMLFRKLLALPEEFNPIGFVRTEESKSALVTSGIPEKAVAVVDVSNENAFTKAMQNENKIDALCICTSAKPKPIDGQVDPNTGRPKFGFPDGDPEQVDWLGQKYQIDACPSGTHVVVCSSMGGTDPNNSLNAFGRTIKEDGTVSGGNILKWKRKAEMYLIEQSKERQLAYTIVHPGGLINEPGGEREIVISVDDEKVGTDNRSIPREDVAQVMLEALRHDKYKNRSFDIRTKPVGEGTITTDFQKLIESLKDRNCDYTLGEIM